MQSVRVKKSELLEIVKKNRAEHREIFLEALEGYRKKLLVLLEEMIARVKAGDRIEHTIRLVQPVDQTKEYDRAIKMLEMSVDETIELDEDKFANLVQDDWHWTDQFIGTNSVYSAKAANYRK